MQALDRPWSHDREQIRQLHHAHGDHIESLYTAFQSLPGNPQGAVIERVGGVRTFLTRGNRWENRPIFHGDETTGQIDDVLAHFSGHQAACVIEINIANSYVDPPKSWEPRLLPHLLSRGCKTGGMRCVWYYDPSAIAEQTPPSLCRIVRFDSDQINEFAAVAQAVSPDEPWTPERRTLETRAGLVHYAASDGQNQPAALGSMFIKGPIAYLSYWETRPTFRGKGLQQAGIRQRVADALDKGCKFVFSVSDYNFASARNLQRCGFRLAYNYLVVTRGCL